MNSNNDLSTADKKTSSNELIPEDEHIAARDIIRGTIGLLAAGTTFFLAVLSARNKGSLRKK